MVNVQKRVIQQSKISCVLLSLLAFPFYSFSAVSLADLDALQAERVLYEAKAAVLKAKNAAEGNGDNIISTSVPGGGVSSGDAGTSSNSLPRLSKVNGNKAELLLLNGDTLIVTAGAMLPGNRWQVTSVGLSGVTVKDIKTAAKQIIN